MHIEPSEYPSSMKYFNFVWALVLLDRATPKMVEFVLEKDFRNRLEYVLGKIKQ